MASIYYRLDKSGNKRYYGSIYNNGKRIRKFLGNSKELAEASLKNLNMNYYSIFKTFILNIKFLAMKKLFFLS